MVLERKVCWSYSFIGFCAAIICDCRGKHNMMVLYVSYMGNRKSLWGKGEGSGRRQCVNPHGVRYMVYGGLWMRKHNIRSQQKYIQKQSSGVADEK